jgi:hypothetical protein
MLWTAFITWPFKACVQFMCARIGMVTGMGLGDALRRKGPRWLLFCGALGLLIANTINVGSDLSGMADAAEMLTGINSHIYVLIFGIGIAYATIRFRYHQIAMVMKWTGRGSLCLRHHRFHRGTRLVESDPRHVCSIVASQSRCLGKSRGYSRDNDQPLFIFLAGIAGGGRRKSNGTTPFGTTPGCNQERNCRS